MPLSSYLYRPHSPICYARSASIMVGAPRASGVHSRGRLSWAVEPGLISGGVSACRLDLRALIVDHLGRVAARAALALL